jgi:hypothetical protein
VISSMLPFHWVHTWPPQHHMVNVDAEVHQEFLSQKTSQFRVAQSV